MYKKIFSLVIVSILVFSFFPIVKPQSWLEGWDYRYELKIDYTKVDETLYNFTILVHLSDNSGIDNNDVTHIFDILGENYDGIAFTQNHETKMFYEIEYWNNTENIADIWVMIPEISNITYTYFYLYYDNEINGSDYNNSVYCWDSDFVMVQHMVDNSTSTILDSTSNDNDGTKDSANNPLEASGNVGEGQNFSSDAISIADDATIKPTDAISVFCWVYPTATDNDDGVFWKATSGDGDYALKFGSTHFRVIINGGARTVAYDDGSLLNQWIYVGFTYDKDAGGTDEIKLYINGDVRQTADYSTAITQSVSALKLGYYYSSSYQFYGVEDEFQFSNIARSSAWVASTYETQNENLLYYGDSENLLSSDIMLVSILALVIALFSFFFVFVTVTRRNEK